MASPTPKLRYDDVSEGDEAPASSHELTRGDLVAYAGASGDMNPMHTDEVAAKQAGLPSVFGHACSRWGSWAER
jgi:acyl dehydratase